MKKKEILKWDFDIITLIDLDNNKKYKNKLLSIK